MEVLFYGTNLKEPVGLSWNELQTVGQKNNNIITFNPSDIMNLVKTKYGDQIVQQINSFRVVNKSGSKIAISNGQKTFTPSPQEYPIGSLGNKITVTVSKKSVGLNMSEYTWLWIMILIIILVLIFLNKSYNKSIYTCGF